MEDTNHQNHTHDKEGNTARVNPVYMQPQSNLWKSEQLPYPVFWHQRVGDLVLALREGRLFSDLYGDKR